MNFDWKDRRLRRTVFVVMHLAVLATIFGFVILPIREFLADRDAHIAEQHLQFARLESIAVQEANVRDMARQVDAEMRKGEFLVGSSDGLISAELQTRLKSSAESAGAHVRAAQNLQAKTAGQLKYSGTRVEIYGNIQALRKAIHEIEGARPYLFITGASMKLALPAGRPNSPEEPAIQAQLDVFAPMQIEGRGP
jgi:Type II secretion system (T2SS), protein M subtype b